MNTLETDVEIAADGSLKMLSPLPAWLKPGRAHMVLTVSADTFSKAHAPLLIPEHSVVELRRAMPKEGLKAGAKGAVVHVYADGEEYEVEFVMAGAKPCLVTLSASDMTVIESA